jgi:hypothetical protein
MKTLIAVKSCARDVGAHQAIRDTWGAYIKGRADLRFFVGRGVETNQSDEISLDAADGYNEISLKVNEILRWGQRHYYDYVVLVDPDTFIVPDRLLALPWGRFDYAGYYLPWRGGFFFGGCGTALSAKAARIVIESSIQDAMDDISIGKILLHGPDVVFAPNKWNRFIGWHFPKNVYAVKNYDPKFPWMDMMEECHLGAPARVHLWNTVIGGSIRTVELSLSREDREEYEPRVR